MEPPSLHEDPTPGPRPLPGGPRLGEDSRVGIVGSGPAGSFFAYFLLDRAAALGRRLEVDIYESRDFCSPAPAGCNMCGGVVSESLVQLLAAEGIALPSSVIQRGIDSYVLHMDVGSVRIDTPLREMRVGAVHRGLGPRDIHEAKWRSFDDFLQSKAVEKGARLCRERVEKLTLDGGYPHVHAAGGRVARYDLLVVAGGVNSDAPQMVEAMGIGYRAPKTTTTFIREYFLGKELLDRTLGSSMHVFLLNIPRLEFAAIIPKGEYATVCLLGHGLDKKLTDAFMAAPEVRGCLPPGVELPQRSCQCSPRINVGAYGRPYADRVLLLGDCGVTRLYKDGIGAAYRTAKVAAAAAVHHGVSAASFDRHFWPAVRAIEEDNRIGRFTFGVTHVIQQHRTTRRAMLRMTADEQGREGHRRRMSQALWDIFTGSAQYKTVLMRTVHPAFIGRLCASFVTANLPGGAPKDTATTRPLTSGPLPARAANGRLGRLYQDHEVVVREGDPGSCMYFVQEGEVEILKRQGGADVPLRVLGQGSLIGEMSLFDQEVRSATVRARGEARLLTIDKETFLGRVQEDPSLAMYVVKNMSRRIRELSDELTHLRGSGPP